MALHANASALCANDLNDPDLRRHAINLYQASISRLQKALKGPNWHDPVVMYTCMIMTLFEVYKHLKLINLAILTDALLRLL